MSVFTQEICRTIRVAITSWQHTTRLCIVDLTVVITLIVIQHV